MTTIAILTFLLLGHAYYSDCKSKKKMERYLKAYIYLYWWEDARTTALTTITEPGDFDSFCINLAHKNSLKTINSKDQLTYFHSKSLSYLCNREISRRKVIQKAKMFGMDLQLMHQSTRLD